MLTDVLLTLAEAVRVGVICTQKQRRGARMSVSETVRRDVREDREEHALGAYRRRWRRGGARSDDAGGE